MALAAVVHYLLFLFLQDFTLCVRFVLRTAGARTRNSLLAAAHNRSV